MRRKIFSWSDIRSENGSNVTQSGGVALAAAILITTIMTLTPMLSSQVERAFICLAAALSGGGGGCSSGSASAGTGGTFQVTTARLPNLRDYYDPPTEARSLLPEERALAELIFGPGTLDLDKVRVTSKGFFLEPRPFVTRNTIRWPMSVKMSPRELAHELIHVYQYQKDGLRYALPVPWNQSRNQLHRWFPDTFSKPYRYGGEDALRQAQREGKRFADFNMEQQGEIVADYYTKAIKKEDTSAYDSYIREMREAIRQRNQPPSRPRGWLWNPPWAGDVPDAP